MLTTSDKWFLYLCMSAILTALAKSDVGFWFGVVAMALAATMHIATDKRQ